MSANLVQCNMPQAEVSELIRNRVTETVNALTAKIGPRNTAIENAENPHWVIYAALGFNRQESFTIDAYQSVGRFLWKQIGSLMEYAALCCYQDAFDNIISPHHVPNPVQGQRPVRFEIDILHGNLAIEVKWRDATTDGDHVNKEHRRLNAISSARYTPVRIMFFEPLWPRAIRIQNRIRDAYVEQNGQYYSGLAAWNYVREQTGIDLERIFEEIAAENQREWGEND